RKSGQQRILIELLLLRFSFMEGTVALEEVLRALGGGTSEGAGGSEEGTANPEWGRAAAPDSPPPAPASARSPARQTGPLPSRPDTPPAAPQAGGAEPATPGAP